MSIFSRRMSSGSTLSNRILSQLLYSFALSWALRAGGVFEDCACSNPGIAESSAVVINTLLRILPDLDMGSPFSNRNHSISRPPGPTLAKRQARVNHKGVARPSPAAKGNHQDARTPGRKGHRSIPCAL